MVVQEPECMEVRLVEEGVCPNVVVGLSLSCLVTLEGQSELWLPHLWTALETSQPAGRSSLVL